MTVREVQRDPEARLIYAFALVVTLPVIGISVARGGRIGGGTTLCMLIAGAAIVGLVHDWRRRVRLPRARVVSGGHLSSRVGDAAPVRDELVLVVEDEPGIQQTIQHALSAHGITCVLAPTLEAAGRVLATHTPAAILLDLGLPDGNGMTLLRAIAQTIPVIVVSAGDRDEDRLGAIDAGARDYLPKPFDALLLAQRVADVMARREEPTMKLMLDDVEVDFAQMTIRRDAKVIPLTQAEANALAMLATHRGSIVGHRQLAEAAWRNVTEYDGTELRLLLAGLRRKLEKDPARPRFLLAEPGGYRLQREHR